MARAKPQRLTNRQRAFGAICRQGSGSFSESAVWTQVKQDASYYGSKLGPRAHTYIHSVVAELKQKDHLIDTEGGRLRVNPSVRPVYREAFAETCLDTDKGFRVLCMKLATDFGPDEKSTRAMLFKKVQRCQRHIEALLRQVGASAAQRFMDARQTDESVVNTEADCSMDICDTTLVEADPCASPIRLPRTPFNEKFAYPTPRSQPRHLQSIPTLPEPEPSPTPCRGLFGDDVRMDLGEGPSWQTPDSRASTPDVRACRDMTVVTMQATYDKKSDATQVTLSKKLQVLVKELHHHEQEYERLINENEQEKRRGAESRQQCEVVTRERDGALETVHQLHERVEEQDQLIKEKDAQIESLKTELSSVHRELDVAIREVEAIDCERRELQQALTSERENSHALQDKLDEKEAERQLLNDQVRELTAEREKIKKRLDGLMAHYKSMQALMADMDQVHEDDQ